MAGTLHKQPLIAALEAGHLGPLLSLQLFQGGEGSGQQLQDDGGIDVWYDAYIRNREGLHSYLAMTWASQAVKNCLAQVAGIKRPTKQRGVDGAQLLSLHCHESMLEPARCPLASMALHTQQASS